MEFEYVDSTKKEIRVIIFNTFEILECKIEKVSTIFNELKKRNFSIKEIQQAFSKLK
jgi:hypothetical protein